MLRSIRPLFGLLITILHRAIQGQLSGSAIRIDISPYVDAACSSQETKPRKRMLEISERSDLKPFFEEDIIYRGIPIGRYTYGYARVSDRSLKGIESIGRFTSIADQFAVAAHHHPLDWVSTNPALYAKSRGIVRSNKVMPKPVAEKNAKVRIGHDVWIGERVLLLRPVTIGHGCVVGAGSVVTVDVPPYAVVAGVPARVLRFRVPEELIPDFLSIAWWEWSIEKLRETSEDFYDPGEFIRKHKIA